MRRLIETGTNFLQADKDVAPTRYGWARHEFACAVEESRTTADEVERCLEEAIERVETATSAGNGLLAHWLPGAKDLLEKLKRKE